MTKSSWLLTVTQKSQGRAFKESNGQLVELQHQCTRPFNLGRPESLAMMLGEEVMVPGFNIYRFWIWRFLLIPPGSIYRL